METPIEALELSLVSPLPVPSAKTHLEAALASIENAREAYRAQGDLESANRCLFLLGTVRSIIQGCGH